jgi:hypothetical protein
MEHAAKLYKRWHNPFKNSPWGKYDTEKLPVYEAPVEQLAQVRMMSRPTARTPYVCNRKWQSPE